MSLVRSVWARALWSGYPLLVFFVITVTANHYWFDAAAGAAVACLAAVSAHQLARLRPHAWSWRARRPTRRPPDVGSVAPEPAAPGRPAEEGAGVASFRAYARGRLIESRLTPNAISISGLILNLAAAVLVTQRLFFLAGVSFIVGSVMDTLDGRYSRMSGKGTLFGAFLDSTLDRIEEGIVLTAVAWYFADSGDAIAASACVITVLGSLMVSYTRARAEALGVECKVGIATRPVRVVILSIGLVFAKGAGVLDIELLAPAIYAMGALTALTVVQRVWHVRRQLSALEEV